MQKLPLKASLFTLLLIIRMLLTPSVMGAGGGWEKVWKSTKCAVKSLFKSSQGTQGVQSDLSIPQMTFKSNMELFPWKNMPKGEVIPFDPHCLSLDVSSRSTSTNLLHEIPAPVLQRMTACYLSLEDVIRLRISSQPLSANTVHLSNQLVHPSIAYQHALHILDLAAQGTFMQHLYTEEDARKLGILFDLVGLDGTSRVTSIELKDADITAERIRGLAFLYQTAMEATNVKTGGSLSWIFRHFYIPDIAVARLSYCLNILFVPNRSRRNRGVQNGLQRSPGIHVYSDTYANGETYAMVPNPLTWVLSHREGKQAHCPSKKSAVGPNTGTQLQQHQIWTLSSLADLAPLLPGKQPEMSDVVELMLMTENMQYSPKDCVWAYFRLGKGFDYQALMDTLDQKSQLISYRYVPWNTLKQWVRDQAQANGDQLGQSSSNA